MSVKTTNNVQLKQSIVQNLTRLERPQLIPSTQTDRHIDSVWYTHKERETHKPADVHTEAVSTLTSIHWSLVK